MQTARSLFDYFKGLWSIKRDLGKYGIANGVAKFTEADECLLYREDLQVNIRGFGGDSYKNYRYEIQDDDLYKKFDDGRLFYKLQIVNKNYATGDHRCEQDDYHAIYTFLDGNNFTLKYEVSTWKDGVGASKKYDDIVTEYVRIEKSLSKSG